MRLEIKARQESRLIPIGRVAKLLSIETSKIRFWESRKLVDLNRDSRDHRMFDRDTIGRLFEVAHLRKINIPVAKVRSHFRSSYSHRRKNLYEAKQSIDKQIEQLTHIRKCIERRLKSIDEIAFLKTNSGDGLLDVPDLSHIVSFDMFNPVHIEGYVEDPSNYISVIDCSCPHVIFDGIILSGERKGYGNQEFPVKLNCINVNESGIKKIETGKQKLEFENLIKDRMQKDSLFSEIVLFQFLESSVEDNQEFDYFKYWFIKK
ncbi:MerR family transcriptional regulator [Enterococcus casseliflavus]|nr:MerR family transcriptional regulator [Enterococcus casseliflavus]